MVFEIQAHRGARSFFPENTIQAFCKAAELGIRIIELDLVVSRDMEILVSHDPWLNGPLCSDPLGNPLPEDDRSRYVIYEMPYREIAAFDCGRPHPSFPSQLQVLSCKPLLRDVFSSVDAFMLSSGLSGRMIFNLEVKSWPGREGVYHPDPSGYARLVMDVVTAAGFRERVRIQSFDYRVVREAWKLDKELSCGLLVNKSEHIFPFLSELGFVPEYLNPSFQLAVPDLLGELHRRGIKVIPWTVNRPEDMLEMKRIGADGLITDYPERALGLPGLLG
ncbi:MAG: glycerophosphodiester phosphodiesterase [Chlorobiaceae bacterium]|nr:glycerophosphodiester phosphodiesterase [Chlorobiaceae bacterium]NTW09726.1 glycerophosphodiester phosphodiesterase [Chlorobiaceae bacterium]